MIFALVALTLVGVFVAIYSMVIDSKTDKKSSQEKTKDLLSADKGNSLQEQVDHFKERALELESLFNELQSKLNNTEAQKANVEAQISELTNANSKRNDLVAQMEQQKDELTKELNQIKTADSQTQDRIKKSEQQTAELKEELYKERKESQKLKEKIGRSNEVAERLSNQIKTADSQTQDRIKKSEQQTAELKEELYEERKESQKLREKIDRSSEVTVKLSDEKRKLIEKNELLRKQVDELIEEKNGQAEKEQSKRESLSEKNQEFSSEAETVENDKETLKQQNHDTEHSLEKNIPCQKDDLSPQVNPVLGSEVPETDKKQLERSIKSRGIKRKKIGRICVERGLITSAVLDKAVEHHQKLRVSLIHYLISRGYLVETDLAQCLSSQFGVPFLPIENCEISADIIKYVSYEIAKKYQLIPIDKVGDMLSVIMADPTDIEAIRAVVSSSRCSVNVFVGLNSEITKAIKYNYSKIIDELKKEYKGPENRKSERFKTDVVMNYLWNNIYVESRTKNVSLHGMAFECKDKLPINKKIKVQMFLPDSVYDDPLEIRARVARVRELEDGNFEIGLKFMHISELSLNQIMNYARSIFGNKD